MDLINHYIEVLSNFSNGSMIGTIAVILEFVMRLVPTDKPKSIFYVLSGVVHLLGQMFNVLGDLLDKLIPQKVKQ